MRSFFFSSVLLALLAGCSSTSSPDVPPASDAGDASLAPTPCWQGSYGGVCTTAVACPSRDSTGDPSCGQGTTCCLITCSEDQLGRCFAEDATCPAGTGVDTFDTSCGAARKCCALSEVGRRDASRD